MAKVLVPLANGFEELEAVTITDLLTRAGVEVITAGLEDGPVLASRGLSVNPKVTLDEISGETFDLVFLPGGLPGADNLNSSKSLHQLIKDHTAKGLSVAAICAAPRVLADAGLLSGRRVTSFPGGLEGFGQNDFIHTGSALEIDGNIFTSRGPGTAMQLAFALIERLCGIEMRQTIQKQMVADT